MSDKFNAVLNSLSPDTYTQFFRVERDGLVTEQAFDMTAVNHLSRGQVMQMRTIDQGDGITERESNIQFVG